jgi:ribosomal protein S27AE
MLKSFLGILRSDRPENKTELLKNFLEELIIGENYKFGEPWQLTSHSLSAVVPITRTFDQARNYLVLQEIPKDRIIVTDSGHINKVNVALKGVEKPVFVRAGTIFKGQGTQSRTSGMGVVLEPEKENLVDVYCVHATHPISHRSSFAFSSNVVPRRVEEVLVSPSKSQARVWESTAVRGFRARVTHCPQCGSSRLLQNYEAELVCVKCGYVIPAMQRGVSMHRDNLVANLDEMTKFNEEVENMLSKIPADLDNQVGVVIIDSRGVLGLEMFDHPDSWRAFSRSVVRNYADVLAKERAADGLFELRTERVPDAIKGFLEKAQKLSETPVFKNRISETRIFSGDLAGEYTCMGSNVIHLILKRKTIAQG